MIYFVPSYVLQVISGKKRKCKKKPSCLVAKERAKKALMPCSKREGKKKPSCLVAKERAKKSPHAMRAWLEKVVWIRSP
jgi:hypothetical protein